MPKTKHAYSLSRAYVSWNIWTPNNPPAPCINWHLQQNVSTLKAVCEPTPQTFSISHSIERVVFEASTRRQQSSKETQMIETLGWKIEQKANFRKQNRIHHCEMTWTWLEHDSPKLHQSKGWANSRKGPCCMPKRHPYQFSLSYLRFLSCAHPRLHLHQGILWPSHSLQSRAPGCQWTMNNQPLLFLNDASQPQNGFHHETQKMYS